MTPVELDLAEREINRNLARTCAVLGTPRRRVCLHPDRTVSRPEVGTETVECDYCPARRSAVQGLPASDLMPHLYLEE